MSIAQFVGMRGTGSIVILGDSNPAGAGQDNGYFGGYCGRLTRSLMNSYDRGVGKDCGLRYETLLDCAQYFTQATGITGYVAAFEPGGAANARARLNAGAGHYLEMTGREIMNVALYYDLAGSAPDSTWYVTVDGVPAASGTVNISETTGLLGLTYPANQYIQKSSKVRFTCTSGSILIQGFEGIRSSANAPRIWVAPEGSQGFSDFAAPERVRIISKIVNNANATGKKLVVICLALNNMSSKVGKQLPVADFICQLDNLVAQYRAALGGASLCSFVWVMPHKPNEVLQFAPYEEYMAEGRAHCEDNNIEVVSTDRSILGKTTRHLKDELHLDDEGHCNMAQLTCSSFGVQMDTYYPIS